MRPSKSKAKTEAHHSAQVVWTVIVAASIALILLKQSSRGRPAPSAALTQDQILEPQRRVADTQNPSAGLRPATSLR